MVCFDMVWFWLEISNGKEAKIPFLYNPEALRLGKREAPKLPVSTLPQRRLLYLSVGPHLGEVRLCLSESEVLFFSHFFR